MDDWPSSTQYGERPKVRWRGSVAPSSSISTNEPMCKMERSSGGNENSSRSVDPESYDRVSVLRQGDLLFNRTKEYRLARTGIRMAWPIEATCTSKRCVCSPISCVEIADVDRTASPTFAQSDFMNWPRTAGRLIKKLRKLAVGQANIDASKLKDGSCFRCPRLDEQRDIVCHPRRHRPQDRPAPEEARRAG